MGILDRMGASLTNGLMGNLSERTPEDLQREYGAYLMEGEIIQTGFVLVRDVVIFTDRRIMDFDKQGATGTKCRVNSIYLDSIINITAETAGFGIDDSELSIEYITSPFYKASGGVTLATRKFEFPKRYQIQDLYRWLQEVAYTNHCRINA